MLRLIGHSYTVFQIRVFYMFNNVTSTTNTVCYARAHWSDLYILCFRYVSFTISRMIRTTVQDILPGLACTISVKSVFKKSARLWRFSSKASVILA